MTGGRMNKSELRKKFSAFRTSLPQTEKSSLDQQITENILCSSAFAKCDTLFTFISTDREISTRFLIESAWERCKKVAVPRCTDNGFELEFFYLSSWDQLQSGKYGILEPIRDLSLSAIQTGDSLCIVPAFCYDNRGYRVGYGKGYYDRFLNSFSGCAMGVCYSECLTEYVPNDEYDMAVDIVVTENATINIDKQHLILLS